MLHTSDLTPHKLIHSRLIGKDDIVSLSYSKTLQEARFDKDNDPVRQFFDKTSFLEDMRIIVNDSVVSTENPINWVVEKIENKDNIKSIRDGCLKAIVNYKPFKMMFIEYSNKLCSVETSFEVKMTVEKAFDISEECINLFHAVVQTNIGKIQSTSGDVK